jgi:ubiquinone/menaquinone biosynthesis C-methylase UbiE
MSVSRDALDAQKQRERRTWAVGDYDAFAAPFVIASELLCEAVALRAGQAVLDVATGTGHTALAAARRFCDVTGIDFVPTMIERARERAATERLPISFQVADAEALPFPDAAFDTVLSTFGVMAAPDQERAARELLRVCRSGGAIGLTNWPADSGFVEVTARVLAPYQSPPPPGIKSRHLWSDEERLRELFGDGVASLRLTRRTLFFRQRSVPQFVALLRTSYPRIAEAFQALDEPARAALAAALAAVTVRLNRSGDETVLLPADYVEVVAIRR